jgi:hypothetical protein
MLAWSRCRLTHRDGVGEGVGEDADAASVRVKLSSVAVRDSLSPLWLMNAVVLAVCVEVPDVRPLIRGLRRPLLVAGEPDPVDVEEAEPDGLGSVVEDDGVVVLGGVGRIVGGVGGVVPVELDPVELGDELGCTWTQSCIVAPLTADICAGWVRSAGAEGARMAAGPSDAPACPDAAAATIPKLEADTTRKPPAARLTVGRMCGKRMKALLLPGCASAKRVFESSICRGYFRRISPRLNDASILDT